MTAVSVREGQVAFPMVRRGQTRSRKLPETAARELTDARQCPNAQHQHATWTRAAVLRLIVELTSPVIRILDIAPEPGILDNHLSQRVRFVMESDSSVFE